MTVKEKRLLKKASIVYASFLDKCDIFVFNNTLYECIGRDVKGVVCGSGKNGRIVTLSDLQKVHLLYKQLLLF